MKPVRCTTISVVLFLSAALACNKSATEVQNSQQARLNYGDSVFYISNQPADILVSPRNAAPGRFASFPDGLEINTLTGVINVSKSEAGMRYRVTNYAASGDSSNAFIVISGINFPDKYYFLDNGDTMALPVYNANASNKLPAGSFDEDKVANNSGCAMKTTNGQINLSESIRNGLFGSKPKNDTRKDFEVKYRLDDPSARALNKIKILLYYYDRITDVPASLNQTVQEHQAMTLQPNNQPVNTTLMTITSAKPRPPCIVVIGHR